MCRMYRMYREYLTALHVLHVFQGSHVCLFYYWRPGKAVWGGLAYILYVFDNLTASHVLHVLCIVLGLVCISESDASA